MEGDVISGGPMEAWQESISQQLATSRLLRELPPEAMAALSGRVVQRSFTSGEVLCRAGETATGAYLVVSGRFQAEAGGRRVGEIGQGELVGEISLLTGEARSATVTAMRDSETFEVPAKLFSEVLANHPECYQAISGQLVERLQRVLTTTLTAKRATVFTLVHDARPSTRETVDRFIEQFGSRAVVVHHRDIDLGALEMANDVVVIAPDPSDEGLRRWAIGQCDIALAFVDATSRPADAADLVADGRTELVLVHPAHTKCPTGTRRWLDTLTVGAHHHVRHGSLIDLKRVGRRLLGAETILVCSGGGARGLAHAGLYRALHERSVGIDGVVGVSAGAVAATVIAMGMSPEEAGRTATRLFSDGGSPVDLTIPTTALASGRRLNQRLRELCGEDRMLEDLWLPTSVVSTNLTTSDIHTHQTGLLWRAIRASTAIPGVFPPVADPVGLLVDGGVVANLPVDLARQLHPGATVIASDVGKKTKLLPGDFPDLEPTSRWRGSGWRHDGLRASASRMRHRSKVPSMVRILAQLTALGGTGSAQSRGDLHIEFTLDGFGIFDFRKGSQIVASGYAQSQIEIDTWLLREAEAAR